jgi:hypothetical protein
VKTAGLFAVLVLAKAAAVAGHSVPFSLWSPLAYFWQDAFVALAFAIVELALSSRPRTVWTIYLVLTMYAAINVPVVRVLSTPLTWAMWRAAEVRLRIRSRTTRRLRTCSLWPRLSRRPPCCRG